MLKTTATILTLTIFAFATAQNIFQKAFGTANYEEVWGFDLTSDSGYILGGYTNTDNALLIKLNSNGDTLWTKEIDAGGWDLPYSIQQTSDNGYIIGGRTSGFGAGGLDMFLIKTDVNGNNQWTKAIGGSGDETVNCVKQTMDGGFILAGNTYSFSTGLNDFYIVKTNSLGNILWSKSIGGTSNDNAYSIVQTTDSGYVAVGLTLSAGAGDKDVLAVKLDKNGNISWMKTYGGTGDDRANSIEQTTDGGFIISGVTNSFGAGNYDFNLIKVDSAGNLTWEKTYGGNGDEWAYCVQQTTDNGYILSGYTTSFGAGNADYYMVKTNSTGDTLWTKTFGGTMADYTTAIKQTPDNGFAVIGYSQSFAVGSYDFYFVKTDNNGNGICNQNNTNTIISTPTQTVTTPTLTVSMGGIVNTTTPTVSNGTIINSLCTNVGIQSIIPKNSHFIIYPNPFSTQTTLWTANPLTNATFAVDNCFGQTVAQINNISGETIVFNRDNLPSGLYFVRLTQDNKIIMTDKLVITY